MPKKTITEIQDIVLSGFEHTLRNAMRNPQPTLVDKIIAESRKRAIAFAAKNAAQPPQPFISHYNPDNPLHALKGLNRYERKAKTAEMIKAGIISK